MRTLLCSIVCLLGSVSTLHAAPTSSASRQAAAAIEEGYKLRVAGKHEEALGAFERAYQLEPSGKALTMLAATEQELKRWTAAEEHAKAALASSDAYVRKNRQSIEALVETIGKHIGSLKVGGPEGASLSVDGGMAASLPLDEPLRLPEGEHALLVTRNGFFPWEQKVQIVGGQAHEVAVAMLPERPLPRLEDMSPASVPTAQESAPRTTVAPHRKLGWGIAAGSAALAIFGATLWAVDGNSIDETRQADTKGGPLLLGLGVAGLIAGGLLISGAF